MRSRATSREHIDRVALELFLTHGYANVTTDEIIEECGVSRPTFFRYVATRDALVLDHIAKFGADVAEIVRNRKDEHGWVALREAMCRAIEGLDSNAPIGMAFRILQSAPGIRSSALEFSRTWRNQLTESLIDCSHYSSNPERCEAAAAMAIGLFQMVWARPTVSTVVLRDAFDDAQSLTEGS